MVQEFFGADQTAYASQVATHTHETPRVLRSGLLFDSHQGHLTMQNRRSITAALLTCMYGTPSLVQHAAAQTCPPIGSATEHFLPAVYTDLSTGRVVQPGDVVPVETPIQIDLHAIATGSCDNFWNDGTNCHLYWTQLHDVAVILPSVSWTTDPPEGNRSDIALPRVQGLDPTTGRIAGHQDFSTQSPDTTGPSRVSPYVPGKYSVDVTANLGVTSCNFLDHIDMPPFIFYARAKDDDPNYGPPDCNAGVGEPVNVTNGNTSLSYVDVRQAGSLPLIALDRYYNSGAQARVGMFGKGWSSTYEEGLVVMGSFARLRLATGRSVFFTLQGAEDYLPLEGAGFQGKVNKTASGSKLTLIDGTIHNFSQSGKLLSIADRFGNHVDMTYDSSNQLISVADTLGHGLSFTYDRFGCVSTVQESTGATTIYSYAYPYVLGSLRYVDGSGYNYTYAGSDARITSVSDAMNNVLETHTYDAQGRATTSTRGGNAERLTLNYVSSTETDVTDANGRVLKYYYSAGKSGRNVVNAVDGGCCSASEWSSWTYDSDQRQTGKTDGLGHAYSYTYTNDGSLAAIIDPSGDGTEYTYGPYGQVATRRDALGNIWTNSFDASGNIIASVSPVGSATSFSYDDRGRVSAATNVDGAITLTYDASGNITKLTRPSGRFDVFQYDTKGRITSITDYHGALTAYTYDARGRILSTTTQNGTTQFGYDLGGRLSSTTDPLGAVANISYDATSRMSQWVAPGAHTTSLTYDSMSRRSAIINPDGQATLFGHDAQGRLTSITFPGGDSFSYSFDMAGRQTSMLVVGGVGTNYTYDATNRVTSEMYSDATPTVTIEYSHAGDLLSCRTTSESIMRTYDANRRLSSEASSTTGITNTVQYDGAGRVSSLGLSGGTLPLGGLIAGTYTYDMDGAVMQVSSSSTPISLIFSRLANGFVGGTTAGALTTVESYSNVGQLVSMTASAANTIYTETVSTRDGLGRITQKVDSDGATSETIEYVYDVTGRVTDVSEHGALKRSYAYDKNGNRTLYTTSTGSVVGRYGADDRLISYCPETNGNLAPVSGLPCFTYTYLANGTIASRTDVATGVTTTYGYTPSGGLASATTSTGAAVTYELDSLGRRVGKIVDGAHQWTLVYGPNLAPLAQLDANGNLLATFVYANANTAGVPQLMVKSGVAYRILSDHIGTVRFVVNASTGAVTQRLDYDEFGNVLADTNPGFQPFGFAGGIYDADTGLVRFAARDYDAVTGRWTAKDPILFDGGQANLYEYVSGDPVNKSDPNGLAWGHIEACIDQYVQCADGPCDVCLHYCRSNGYWPYWICHQEDVPTTKCEPVKPPPPWWLPFLPFFVPILAPLL